MAASEDSIRPPRSTAAPMARSRRPAVSVPDHSNLAAGQHPKIAAPDVISTKESTVVAQMRGQPVVYDLGLATSTFIAWPRPRWRPVHMRRGIETTSQAAPAYSRGPGAGVGKRARPR